MSKTALVVEDTPANRNFFERLLTQAGFEVQGVDTGKAALEAIEQLDELALAVIDMEMPDMSGLHLTTQLQNVFPTTYTIIATMHDERTLIESAIEKGCNLLNNRRVPDSLLLG